MCSCVNRDDLIAQYKTRLDEALIDSSSRDAELGALKAERDSLQADLDSRQDQVKESEAKVMQSF